MESVNTLLRENTIQIKDEGHGPAIVLMHGWPVTDYHWRLILPALHAEGFRTFVLTPRGLGDDAQIDNFKKLALAKEIRSALIAHSVKNYALLGHDWGGTIGYLIAAEDRLNCWALAVEEEILPGISVEIPYPGSLHYPTWHGPFNRSIGLGEALIKGNENQYYSTFLRESAGPNQLEASAISQYLKAYNSEKQLVNTLGYYRTQMDDNNDIKEKATFPLEIPTLCIGGFFGMGEAVIEGMRKVAKNIEGVILQKSGHYPAEQEPDKFAIYLVKFLKKSYSLYRNF